MARSSLNCSGPIFLVLLQVKMEKFHFFSQKTERFGDGKIMTNAMMSYKQVEKYCVLDSAGEMMLKHAMTEFGLSARAHDKICKSPERLLTSTTKRQ